MADDAPGNDRQHSATPAGFMTQAEYRRHRRYTNRSTVSRLVSRGLLVMRASWLTLPPATRSWMATPSMGRRMTKITKIHSDSHDNHTLPFLRTSDRDDIGSIQFRPCGKQHSRATLMAGRWCIFGFTNDSHANQEAACGGQHGLGRPYRRVGRGLDRNARREPRPGAEYGPSGCRDCDCGLAFKRARSDTCVEGPGASVMAIAIYARVSTEEQRERQSIETQYELGQSFCKVQNLPVYRVYGDNGVSGTIPLDRRPEGSQIFRDARLGKFDEVLVYKLDRLARDARHTDRKSVV